MLNIIWDLDGTLIDSEAEVLYHLNHALKDSSVNPEDAFAPIRIGPPLDIMLKNSFSPEFLENNKIEEVIFHYRKRYDSSGFETTKPFAGIDEIIDDTEHFTHYIVTNKPYHTSVEILKVLNWYNKISLLKSPSDDANQRKSKTELFAEIIAESGSDVSSFISIGDMRGDCIAANENKITAIGVLWGTGTREELEGCSDYMFENVKQLCDFLYGRNSKCYIPDSRTGVE